MDLVLGAWEDRWDSAIIVSGDGDLARAVVLARAIGKDIDVACCPGSLSGLLRAEVREVRWLDAVLLRGFGYSP